MEGAAVATRETSDLRSTTANDKKGGSEDPPVVGQIAAPLGLRRRGRSVGRRLAVGGLGRGRGFGR